MSEICMFYLKDNNLKFKDMNNLAKQLVAYALNNELGVNFKSGQDVYIDGCENFKNYFYLSHSFLYENSDLFEFNKIYQASNMQSFFNNKYNYFIDIFNILKKNNITCIEIFISEDNITSIAEFEEIKVDMKEFLSKLFDEFFNTEHNNYFLTAKFIVDL